MQKNRKREGQVITCHHGPMGAAGIVSVPHTTMRKCSPRLIRNGIAFIRNHVTAQGSSLHKSQTYTVPPSVLPRSQKKAQIRLIKPSLDLILGWGWYRTGGTLQVYEQQSEEVEELQLDLGAH